jgi:hypothetical protein
MKRRDDLVNARAVSPSCALAIFADSRPHSAT